MQADVCRRVCIGICVCVCVCACVRVFYVQRATCFTGEQSMNRVRQRINNPKPAFDYSPACECLDSLYTGVPRFAVPGLCASTTYAHQLHRRCLDDQAFRCLDSRLCLRRVTRPRVQTGSNTNSIIYFQIFYIYTFSHHMWCGRVFIKQSVFFSKETIVSIQLKVIQVFIR